MKLDIKHLKNEPDDIKLVDDVVDIILSRVDFSINKLSEEERNIVAVATAQGVIDNGGMSFFFEKDFDDFFPHAMFLKCYDAIGAGDCARAIEDVCNLFPNKMPQADMDERFKFLDKLVHGHDADSDQFFKAERVILGNRRVFELLADYIRRKF